MNNHESPACLAQDRAHRTSFQMALISMVKMASPPAQVCFDVSFPREGNMGDCPWCPHQMAPADQVVATGVPFFPSLGGSGPPAGLLSSRLLAAPGALPGLPRVSRRLPPAAHLVQRHTWHLAAWKGTSFLLHTTAGPTARWAPCGLFPSKGFTVFISNDSCSL